MLGRQTETPQVWLGEHEQQENPYLEELDECVDRLDAGARDFPRPLVFCLGKRECVENMDCMDSARTHTHGVETLSRESHCSNP